MIKLRWAKLEEKIERWEKKKNILKVLEEMFEMTLFERLKHCCGILKTYTKKCAVLCGLNCLNRVRWINPLKTHPICVI